MTVTTKNISANYNVFSVFSIIGVFIAALAFTFDALDTKIDAIDTKIETKFDHINTSINKNMELINQNIEAQKEINRLEIQSAVQEEFLNVYNAQS